MGGVGKADRLERAERRGRRSPIVHVLIWIVAAMNEPIEEENAMDEQEHRRLNVAEAAAVGSIAVANGVLVQIVMLARLFYGMASNGEPPALLARIGPRTRVTTRRRSSPPCTTRS